MSDTAADEGWEENSKSNVKLTKSGAGNQEEKQ